MTRLRWIVATLVIVVWASFVVQVVRGEDVMEALFWAAIATTCLSSVDLARPRRRKPDGC